jgi:hypothetical protein
MSKRLGTRLDGPIPTGPILTPEWTEWEVLRQSELKRRCKAPSAEKEVEVTVTVTTDAKPLAGLEAYAAWHAKDAKKFGTRFAIFGVLVSHRYQHLDSVRRLHDIQKRKQDAGESLITTRNAITGLRADLATVISSGQDFDVTALRTACNKHSEHASRLSLLLLEEVAEFGSLARLQKYFIKVFAEHTQGLVKLVGDQSGCVEAANRWLCKFLSHQMYMTQ